MSGGEPRHHVEMLGLALEVVTLLGDYCTRIAIGGSLRRGKAMVGDIEIVCQPEFRALPTGRNGFIQVKQDAVKWKCDRLLEDRVFEPRLNLNGNPESWADRHKRAWYKGVKLDLFIVQPDRSWGYTMLIRTGPGDANGVLVTRDGVRNHEGNLGICPEPYAFKDGDLHVGEMRIDTPEEKDVFQALGLPYIAPPLRSVEMYQRWAARRSDPLPEAFLQSGYRSRGWVGAMAYRNDVWKPITFPGVVGVEREPYFLKRVKQPIQEQVVA